MDFRQRILYCIVAVALVALTGCIEENLALVNPPSQTESVRVRFVNLGSAKTDKVLSLGNDTNTTATAYGRVSGSIVPRADSCNLIVKTGGGETLLRTKYKQKFIKDMKYSVFYLPLLNDSTSKTSDTLYFTSTVTGLTRKTKIAYVKVYNAVPDLNSTYTLTAGCPSGEKLSSATYHSSGSIGEIRSDTVAVSLTKYTSGTYVSSRLYSVCLKEYGQYAVVVMKNGSGEEEAYLLNEEDETEGALKLLTEVEQRNSFLRAVNFSRTTVSLYKEPDSLVFTSVPSKSISDYEEIEVCKSTAVDYVGSRVNKTLHSLDSTSFEVLGKYTAFVFDNDTADAGLTVVAEPVFINESTAGKAVVRVINANYKYKNTPLTLSMAAHNSQSDTSLSAGTYLASDLQYGSISEPVIINAGKAPLTLFTSTNPSKLLSAYLTNFEADKSYFLVMYCDESGNPTLTAVADQSPGTTVEPLDEGVLVQIVNARNSSFRTKVSVDQVLTSAVLPALGYITTVVDEGNTTITLNGSPLNITTNKSQRLLVIASGTAAAPDEFHTMYPPVDVSWGNYYRKVINASSTTPSLTVRIDTENGTVFAGAEAIGYQYITTRELSVNKRKNALLFTNNNEIDSKTSLPKVLLRVDDISYAYGKSYSVIFCGTPLGADNNGDGYDDGYFMVFLQEF